MKLSLRILAPDSFIVHLSHPPSLPQIPSTQDLKDKALSDLKNGCRDTVMTTQDYAECADELAVERKSEIIKTGKYSTKPGTYGQKLTNKVAVRFGLFGKCWCLFGVWDSTIDGVCLFWKSDSGLAIILKLSLQKKNILLPTPSKTT